jgi:hypothetical protein
MVGIDFSLTGNALSRWLLQIPIPKQVSETLERLLDIPLIFRLVAGFSLVLLVLCAINQCLKQLDAMLGTGQSIRAKLKGETAAPDLAAARRQLLQASKNKTERRWEDVLSHDQVIALGWQDSRAAVGRPEKPTPAPAATTATVEHSAEVERTWLGRAASLVAQRIFRQPNQETVELAPTERMIDVFRQAAGRLLILGAPGSGKSTTLLELAQDLVAAAEADEAQPVPIIFELSNWQKDSLAIEPWLVAELKNGYNVDPKIGQQLVANHQILPLLDGLDELGLARQSKCAVKINEFLPDGFPTRQAVVCCRTEEFNLGQVTLKGLKGAVKLQPLSNEQIQQYLGDVEQPQLWSALEQVPDLLVLARTPLMLTLRVHPSLARLTLITRH